LAVAAQVVAVWWNGAFLGISLLTDPSELVGQALTMLAMALIVGAIAWRSFLPSPASPVVGIVLALLGAVMTFAWPVAFAIGATWVDTVAPWGMGLGLPQWMGAMTAVLGIGLVLRPLLPTSPPAHDIREP
jgi:hypothetical protein